jgi:hypothetical protein
MSLEKVTVESLAVVEAVLSVAMDHLLVIAVLLEAVAVVLSGVMVLVALAVIADRLETVAHLAEVAGVALEMVVITWVA